MKVTDKQLIQIFPQSKKTAAMYAELFNELLETYGISSKERVAHFISQVGHESMGFTRLVENLNYSAHGLAANYGASTEYADTITTGGNTYRPLGVFLLPT